MVLAFGVMAYALWLENRRAELISVNANEREEESKRKIQAEIEYSNGLKEEARKQRQLLDVMRIRDAGNEIENNNYGAAREVLDQVQPRNGSDPGNRTCAWSLIRQQAEGSDWTIKHSDSVTCVAWSPDGRTLASGSEDNTVRLWDAATGTSLKEFKGHTDSVTSVSWSPDGRTIASGSEDNTVRLWDTATGGEPERTQGP